MNRRDAEQLLAEMNSAAELINRTAPAVEQMLQDELDRAHGLGRAQALALGLALIGSGGVILRRWCSKATAAEVAYAIADALAAGQDLQLAPADFARLLGLNPDDLEAA